MVDPETFAFLAALAQNNRKAWMTEHRAEWDDARRNFTGIATSLHSHAARWDHALAGAKINPRQSHTRLLLEPREREGRALYRTFVDIFAVDGSPSEHVAYYLHLEPGNCHAGAGLFQPSKPGLARLRATVDEAQDDLLALLDDPDFRTTFPAGLVARKTLGRAPDGYAPDHPAADILRMEGFGVRADLPDDDLLEDEAIDRLVEIFLAARPLALLLA
ncbi:MAG: hypothetical protein ACJA1L_002234 [Paracoccaceae bacterium]|jgi:uncharacterized protein (TIGR02453 family)